MKRAIREWSALYSGTPPTAEESRVDWGRIDANALTGAVLLRVEGGCIRVPFALDVNDGGGVAFDWLSAEDVCPSS